MQLEPAGYGGMYWSTPLSTSQGASGNLNANLGDLYLSHIIHEENKC